MSLIIRKALEAHKFYKSLGYKINGYRFVKSFKFIDS